MIYTEATKSTLEQRRKDNPNTIPWRISSTLFSHIRRDVDISPLPDMAGKFYEPEVAT